jgi:hypothetical protein
VSELEQEQRRQMRLVSADEVDQVVVALELPEPTERVDDRRHDRREVLEPDPVEQGRHVIGATSWTSTVSLNSGASSSSPALSRRS